MNGYFFEAEFASPVYDQSVWLRNIELRKPLGLSFSTDELSGEYAHHHIIMVDDFGELIACLVLVPTSEKVLKMRQVVVREGYKGKGYGSKLVLHAEQWAIGQGYSEFVLHARESAVTFYKRMNYDILSERFMEVNIPHFKMGKKLVSENATNSKTTG
jgi:hypothetical protein